MTDVGYLWSEGITSEVGRSSDHSNDGDVLKTPLL